MSAWPSYRLLAAFVTAVGLLGSPVLAAQAPTPEDARERPREPQKTPPPPPRMSNRCYTPAINCLELERARVGSSCWCVTPFGPSYGEIK